MASGRNKLVRQNSILTQVQQKFLTCSICYDIYDEPKCLPCLHTFCKDCLSSYIQSREDYGARRKKGFACPVCRQFVFVKSWVKPISQWVDEIQNNFIIQNMIDSLLPKPEGAKSESDSPLHPEVNRALPSAPPPVVDNRARPTAPPMSEERPARVRPRYNPLRAPMVDDTPRAPRLDPPDGYDWNVLSSGMRHAQSTLDVSPEISTRNLFRNRVNSYSDLTPGRTNVMFAEPRIPWLEATRAKPHNNRQQISDICCLPNNNYVVATDFANRQVLLYKKLSKSRRVQVNGHPCSVAIVDGDKEEIIVVNLQYKRVMVFIKIPNLKIIKEVTTNCNYRSVASMSPFTIIVGSPDYPARIEVHRLDEDCSLLGRSILFQNEGNQWHLSDPIHISSVFNNSFFVSDAGKRCILCFDIIQDEGVSKAVKRYSISPRGDRKISGPGGLFVDKNTGNVYTVDYGSNTVLHIIPDDIIRIETLLTDVDGIKWPASVCMGPGPEPILCVADWEGNITLFNQ